MAQSDIASVRPRRTRLPRPIDNKCTLCGFTPVKAKGLCDRHYRTMLRNGDPTKLQIRPQNIICAVIECEQRAVARGLCKKHYKIARRTGHIVVGDSLRDHPLYGLWWSRRKSSALGDEWRDDVGRFIADVGERPGKNFTLVTIEDGPFGPTNFKWREQIKRLPGESKRAFHARKWQAQVQARPSWDRVRSRLVKYGISAEEYEQKHQAQNGLCAICNQPETSINVRGAINSLAVDHCHTTKKIRDLLCSRCNTTIGRAGESIDLLRAMISYLEKHSKLERKTP